MKNQLELVVSYKFRPPNQKVRSPTIQISRVGRDRSDNESDDRWMSACLDVDMRSSTQVL